MIQSPISKLVISKINEATRKEEIRRQFADLAAYDSIFTRQKSEAPLHRPGSLYSTQGSAQHKARNSPTVVTRSHSSPKGIHYVDRNSLQLDRR
jgi:hypothetical protein